MPATLGSTTKRIFVNDAESRKLHLAFTAVAAVYAGQLVTLDSLGKITPAVATDDESVIVGVCIKDGAIGDLVTVAMRGYAVCQGQATAAIVPGAVKQASRDGTTKYITYTQAGTAALTHAIALEPAAGAGSLFKVLIRD